MKLLLIFLLTTLTKVHCGKQEIEKTLQDSIWKFLQLNVEEYLLHTKEFSIINIVTNESHESTARDEIANFLIKYASVVKNISIFNFLWHLDKNHNPKEYNNKTNFFQRKQVIFIAFETVRQINESLSDNFWTIITSSKSSFIILIVDGNSYENCYADSLTNSSLDNIFKILWTDFGILEVLLIIPDMCKKQINFYKYNILDKTTKKLRIGEKIIHDYENFKGYPLKISVFEKIPTFMRSSELFLGRLVDDDVEVIGRSIGMDAFLMANIVNKLNFTPYIFISDRDDYGGRNDDGSFTGSLKKVIDKVVDISFNSRFLTYYDTDDVEYTLPIYHDEFCVLVPKAQEIPYWMKILLIFDFKCWIFIFFTIFMSIFIWWLVNINFEAEKSGKRKKFTRLSLDILSLVLSIPMHLEPKDLKGRTLIGCILISTLIIAGIFKSSLSTAYSTTTYYKDINTLEELDASELKIYSSINYIFGINISDVGNRLNKKVLPDYEGSTSALSKRRNFAVIDRRLDSEILIEMKYSDNNARHLIHIVDECPMSYNLVYITYKGFPFLRQINKYIGKIVSAGLSEQWYRDIKYALSLKSRPKGVEQKKLSMEDVQASFYILGIGYLIATLVFIYEKFHKKTTFIKLLMTKKNDTLEFVN